MFTAAEDVPDEVKTEILKTMGAVAAAAVKTEGKSMDIYDPEWSGTHVLDSISLSKAKLSKDGGQIYVTFKGTRRRGKKTTRNAEIAFVNEYGRPGNRKKVPIRQRPFVRTAIEKCTENAIKEGENVFHKWLDKL